MDNLANSGWSMDTQGTTTAWQGSQNLGLQSIRDASNGFKRRHHLDSFGSSGDNSDQEQVFQHETVFRVDRHKIESLILGQFKPIKETAGDYFLRVGNETGTNIVWPNRLAYGKKGRNPQIRIGGSNYEAVILAKTIILGHFDCTLKTITMRMNMDVSYTGHSDIIGKGGKTVNSVMSDTGCRIHFPDSNLNNPNQKYNQVTIAGDVEGIEKSRAKIRELSPLVLKFDFIEANFNIKDPFFRAIRAQYNIKLIFLPRANYSDSTTAVIKGCEFESGPVKEATRLLINHISGGTRNTTPITMNMEISQFHHSFVLGQNNININMIMKSTNTKILFPDAADLNILPINKGSVSIIGNIFYCFVFNFLNLLLFIFYIYFLYFLGNIDDVYAAHQQLIGSLPLSMIFDAPDGFKIPIYELHEIMEYFHVDILIQQKKPSGRLPSGSKSIVIKTQERNASAIYAARFRLLKIKDLDQFVVANIPESYDLLQSGSDFNQEKVTRFDSSTDSGSEDEFNANQYPNSPITTPLVSNRLPVFIAITSKFNKLTC